MKKQQKYYVFDEPFNYRRNVDFGKSELSHNPITNPVNDIHHNKYIDTLLMDNQYDNNFNNNINQYDNFENIDNRYNNYGHNNQFDNFIKNNRDDKF